MSMQPNPLVEEGMGAQLWHRWMARPEAQRRRLVDELDHLGLDVVLPGEDQARMNVGQAHLAEGIRLHPAHEVRWVPPM